MHEHYSFNSYASILQHQNYARRYLSNICVPIVYSFRLLHANPFVATHQPKDTPWSLYPVYVENGALFGRPQGQTGADPRFHKGWTPMGERSLPISPWTRLPFIYLISIYIYIYIHLCMAVSHSSLWQKSSPGNPHTNFRFDQLRIYACMHTPSRAKLGMLEAKRRRSSLQTTHNTNLKLRITQTKHCTTHKLKTAHDTNEELHMTQTKDVT